MKATVHVRVSRRKRSNHGWILKIGPNQWFYRHKHSACSALFAVLKQMKLSIAPATAPPKTLKPKLSPYLDDSLDDSHQ